MEICDNQCPIRSHKPNLKRDSNNNLNVPKAYERPLMERNHIEIRVEDDYLPKRYRISKRESPNENEERQKKPCIPLNSERPSSNVERFWMVDNAEYGGPAFISRDGESSLSSSLSSSSSSGRLPTSSSSSCSSCSSRSRSIASVSVSVSVSASVESESSSSGRLSTSRSSSMSSGASYISPGDDDSPLPGARVDGECLRGVNGGIDRLNKAYRRLLCHLPRGLARLSSPPPPSPLLLPGGLEAHAAPSRATSSPLISEDGGSFPSIETEHSESEQWPPLPPTAPARIDLARVAPALHPPSFQSVFGAVAPRCCCALPDPDQWRDLGWRPCGPAQGCLLARLRVECSRLRCPCEALCANCQFQDLDDNTRANRAPAELFYDSGNWSVRARVAAPRQTLLLEVGGTAVLINSPSRPLCGIFLSNDLVVDITSDPASLAHYLRHGTPLEANVRIEQWLVEGSPPRVGVFALRDIEAREELVLHHDEECLTGANEWQSLESEAGIVSLVQSLVHDGASESRLLCLVERLLSPGRPPQALQHLLRLGGVAVLSLLLPACRLRGLLLSQAPFATREDLAVLGVDLSASIGAARLAGLAEQEEETPRDADHCQLPPLWARREARATEEVRVFYWHRAMRRVQWEVPVYPWEGHDAEDRGEDLYDYDGASEVPVTLAEVADMNQELNRIYEIRQRTLARKEARRRQRREVQDGARKDSFRRAIRRCIVGLLMPYRAVNCAEGRITSEADLEYLASKLTLAILRKELKIQSGATERLKVTPMVEAKTGTYLRSYMQSRGAVYRRRPS